jgi:hypothetical protein
MRAFTSKFWERRLTEDPVFQLRAEYVISHQNDYYEKKAFSISGAVY